MVFFFSASEFKRAQCVVDSSFWFYGINRVLGHQCTVLIYLIRLREQLPQIYILSRTD